MKTVWKLADAKNRLSELLNITLSEGMQEISRRDDRFVVLTKDAYDRIAGNKPSFKQALSSIPVMEDINFDRENSSSREFSV
jgi:antitoxin Phd